MEYILNHLGNSIIYLIFFIINILIVISDIRHRQIKNLLLLGLICLLPVWYYYFNIGTNKTDVVKYILAGVILISGILFYTKKNILGSGDIKYGTILILFLGNNQIISYIGNIGAFTIVTLLFWYIYISFYIIKYTKSVEMHIDEIFPKGSDSTTVKRLQYIGRFILDWIFIGMFISFLIQEISLEIFQFIPTGQEYYFLISLSVFLIRPLLRFLIYGKYFYIVTTGILLYFAYMIQHTDIYSFIGKIGIYLQNIWYFALFITGVHILTKKIFDIYDVIYKKLNANHTTETLTIPYSVILFLSFFSGYFFHLNFIQIILKILTS